MPSALLPFQGSKVACTGSSTRRSVVARSEAHATTRRHLLSIGFGAAFSAPFLGQAANAVGQPPVEIKGLCDAECMAQLEGAELVTLPSGLQYKEIVVGTGASPKVGFQVVCNYVAMTPSLRIFESSIDKGKPYDIRVGAGQVLAGLDEGLLSMRVGGTRRLYIPGSMAFPKGLKAGPGRPSVPANSPVVFDVQLLYIPGLEDEDE